jgi:putative transposase
MFYVKLHINSVMCSPKLCEVSPLPATHRRFFSGPPPPSFDSTAHNWKWSSAYAHLAAQDDGLVRVKPMLDRMNDWAAYLSAECDEDTEVIKLHTRTGRPLGSTDFVEHLEAVTGKVLAPRRPGRKEKS